MTNAKSRTRAKTRDANAASRAALAIELRTQGLTYEQIARQCGYASRGACHDAVQRELERVVVEKVDALRREQLLQLDRLQAMCWEMASDEDNKGRLFAVDRLLQIFDRRSKLMGLDLANKGEQIGNVVVVRGMPQGYLGESPVVQERQEGKA